MTNSAQWNKIKPWLIQASFVIAIGICLWFGVRPLRQLIIERMDKIQQLDVMRAYRADEIQKLPELEKQNSLIQSYKKDLMIILSKDELVGFIQKLEELAVSEGVEIEIVARDNTLLESKITQQENGKEKKTTTDMAADEASSPVTADKRKAKSTSDILSKLPLKHHIRLTLIVEAPYEALVRYLAKVETMPYALEILGLSLKEAEKKSDESRPSFSGDFVQSNASQSDGVGEEMIIPTPPSPLILSGEFDLVVYTKE